MSDQNKKNQTLAGRQFDAMVALGDVFAGQADRLFAETRAFQTTVLRNQSVWFSKVIFARSVSDVIAAQREHSKAHYEASVGEARKIVGFLTGLARSVVPSAARKTAHSRVKPVAKLVAVERKAA